MNDEQIRVLRVRDLDLSQTFRCGQCFRWIPCADESWDGVVRGEVINLRLEKDPSGGDDLLTVTGLKPLSDDDMLQISKYLDLDRDYGSIKEELSRRDEKMKEAVKNGGGIHILRQELWEALISFIISQNNNIPRIQGCIENLCKYFGEPIPEAPFKPDAYPVTEQLCSAAFPSPEKLASLSADDLSPVRLGYRAPYLIETARQVLDRGGMEAVEHRLMNIEDPEEVTEYLMGFRGVGPKVANCVALFGCHRIDAFPIDVWMKRLMHRLYGFHEDDIKGMARYARENFGEWAGLAQQYLFYYIRENRSEEK